MEDTTNMVRVVLNERATGAEINEVIESLEMAEKPTIVYSLVLDYLRIKSSELQIEAVQYYEKKREVNKILSEYNTYLVNILELEKNKEITVADRLRMLVERSVNSGCITRENKIYIGEEQQKARKSIENEFSINNLLIYITTCLLGRIEVLKIEKNILEIAQDEIEDIDRDSPGARRNISVYKVEGNIHPIRITGRTTQEDIRKMLTPTNTPTMSIEQYGERMMKMIGEQQITEQKIEEKSESEDLSNEISVQEIEEVRKKKEKEEEFHYGDGNRMGRK